MAYVANGFFMSVDLVDNGNNKTTKTYDLQGADLAEATTNAGTILTALAAVTDATIKGYNIGSRFTNDAFAFPAANVNIENLALITLGITNDPTKSATITIPAPKSTLFVETSGAGANNFSNSGAGQTYWQLFTVGGEAYLSDGETAEVFFSGKRIHRGSRRG